MVRKCKLYKFKIGKKNPKLSTIPEDLKEKLEYESFMRNPKEVIEINVKLHPKEDKNDLDIVDSEFDDFIKMMSENSDVEEYDDEDEDEEDSNTDTPPLDKNGNLSKETKENMDLFGDDNLTKTKSKKREKGGKKKQDAVINAEERKLESMIDHNTRVAFFYSQRTPKECDIKFIDKTLIELEIDYNEFENNETIPDLTFIERNRDSIENIDGFIAIIPGVFERFLNFSPDEEECVLKLGVYLKTREPKTLNDIYYLDEQIIVHLDNLTPFIICCLLGNIIRHLMKPDDKMIKLDYYITAVKKHFGLKFFNEGFFEPYLHEDSLSKFSLTGKLSGVPKKIRDAYFT